MKKVSSGRGSHGTRKRHRRPFWKRLLSRRSQEDRVEYVSRLLVIPVAIAAAALLYGLTIEPTGRKDYVESLTDPLRWTSFLPGTNESSATGRDLSSQASTAGGRSELPVPSAAPVPADTTARGMDSTGTPTEGAGTWVLVREGQTLYDIAREQYGNEAAWKRIWLYNLERLPNPTNVRYGMELYMPPPGELSAEETSRADRLLAELS